MKMRLIAGILFLFAGAAFTIYQCHIQQAATARAWTEAKTLEQIAETDEIRMRAIGIVLNNARANQIVQNGDVFDKAILDATDIKTLVLPDGTKIVRVEKGGQIELYVKKTLEFMGHPPNPISLQDVRNKMGCATKTEDGKVLVATFGEWSTKEGGTKMALLIRMPNTVQVETRKGLSGSQSEGQGKSKDANGVTWYGPASARVGWKAIEMTPDPELTAK